MLRKKIEQVHIETQEIDNPELNASAAAFRSQLKRKGLATLGALFLLVSVIIIGTVAWYTRISNVTGMTMDVAKFDFNANYTGSDDVFTINVGGYLTSTLAEGKAAPGTKGVIPIRMSSGKSETAVKYSLNLDFAEMADEFQNRLRFYYYINTGTAENPVYELHVIDPATATETSSAITGMLAASGETGDTKYEYIYWEWMYELDDEWFAQDGKWYHKADGASERYSFDGNTDKTGRQVFDALYPDEIPEGATENKRTAAIDAFDEFDTNIGLGKANDSLECTYARRSVTKTKDEDADGTSGKLYAYQKAMTLKLHVTGAQAKPVENGGTSPIADGIDGTAIYNANG